MGEKLTRGLKGFGHFGRAYPDSDLVTAWGRFDAVHVFSISERRLVASFATVFSWGGDRLALVGADEPVVVAGAWGRPGVVGYRLDGSVLWQRRDLRQPQHMYPVERAGLAVGMSVKMMHVVDAGSGETVRTVRGADECFHDGRAPVVVVVGRGGGELSAYSAGSWERVWKRPGTTPGDVAFSPDSMVVAGYASAGLLPHFPPEPGCVRCLDFEGDVVWEWETPTDAHVVRVAWNPTLRRWVGVLRSLRRGRGNELMLWSPEGEVVSSAPLASADVAFAGEGSVLLTWTGEVLDVPSLEVLWTA